MIHGQLFLSKVIDSADVGALKRFNITAADMPTESERKALRFIEGYAEQNRGQAPSVETVVAELPEFSDLYHANVDANFEYSARKIKSHSIKQQIADFVNGKFGNAFGDESDGNKLLEDLISEAERIKMRTSVLEKVGTSVKDDVSKFREEYERRREGESYRVWESKFPFINKATGGYVSSNVYVWYGKSGRGKSACTIEEAVELAFQGANVLIWLMEMGWYEGMVRIYTSVSSRTGATITELNGVDMEAGFNSKDIRHAKLPPEFEQEFFAFLERMNDILPGNIIVRGVDDDDFNRRDLGQLEADIRQTNADVVVIDPFYYLDYEKNTSKTTGGDAANTSKKLRRLAGTTQTVVFAITQADEVDEKEDDDGNRELRLPKRSEVSKTKALLQDAAILIAVDTNANDGRGIIGINKGRDGGEGESAEILYLPQIGIIKEMETGEAAASQFDF
jgi:replicative DNA helicase